MDVVSSLHPTDQTLASYGLGKLDDPTAEAVEKHLEGCPDCRRRVGELSSDSFLGRLRDARGASDGPVAGESPADGTVGFLPAPAAPPTAEGLPPGLAEHPDYRIKRELGRGGMGVVYLAHNTLLGRDEVLKVMGRKVVDRPGVLDRFQREIRAVAKLRHPNIVAAYTAFRIDDGLVFAMEYVEGLDLSRVVRTKGPLPVVHAAYFIHQAALGLQHAHEKRTVHRDIKPHNLMLTHDGKARIVKVLDFGLAKASREEKIDSALTREGQALGTPDYIAPEQILNAQDVDIRADLYSLGGTLYFLLTGRPPFRASCLYDIYQAHISRDADPLNLIRPEVPSELAALVAKMLAKDPARRFQTPGEVAQALAPFFKKANASSKIPATYASQAGRTATEAASSRTQPSTEGGTSVRPARDAAEPTSPEARRESMFEIRDEETSKDAPPTSGPGRWPPRKKWPIARGASLFGLIALGVVAIIAVEANRRRTILATGGETAFTVTTEGSPIGVTPGRAPDEEKPGQSRPQVVADGTGGPPTGAGEARNPGGGDPPAPRADGLPAPASRGPSRAVPGTSTKPATELKTDVVYRLVNVNTGEALDFTGARAEFPMELSLADIAPRKSQFWTLTRQRNNSFIISNMESHHNVHVADLKRSGQRAVQSRRRGPSSQWRFERQGESFRILNFDANLALAANETPGESPVVIEIPRGDEKELWRFFEVDLAQARATANPPAPPAAAPDAAAEEHAAEIGDAADRPIPSGKVGETDGGAAPKGGVEERGQAPEGPLDRPSAPPPAAEAGRSYRALSPHGGPLKSAGAEARPPVEPFWPPFTPANTDAWDLGDPGAISVSKQGVTVEAGAHGNFLLTKKSDYRKGALRIALSLSGGAEAFLVLHGRREAGEWRAITSRVAEEEGTVRAGRLGADFSARETGTGAEGTPGSLLVVRFEDDGRGRRAVFVGNKQTATAAAGRDGPETPAGAIGLFVTSGAVRVRHIDVR